MRSTFGVFVVLWFSSVASAQAPATPAAAGPGYGEVVATGMRMLLARDWDNGIGKLREAVLLDAQRPDAFCLIAEGQRGKGLMEEAIETYRACTRLANAANAHRWAARGMQGVADTYERMADRLEDARRAWSELLQFAAAHPETQAAETARLRIQAIDVRTEQEAVMVEVRARIEERARSASTRR